jgi:hypothetical protein
LTAGVDFSAAAASPDIATDAIAAPPAIMDPVKNSLLF